MHVYLFEGEIIMDYKKLRRSDTDRVLGGVCGGLGKFIGIDPVILRVLFVIMTLLAGHGIIVYLILLVVIPLEEPDLVTVSTSNK
jgi:phage shock protein C